METESTIGWECRLSTLKDTARLAKLLVKQLPIPATVALIGTLGAGKTQTVRYFVESLGGESDWVTSPTYVILQSYPTDPIVHHLDAYRVKSTAEFQDVGLQELFDQPAYTIIEWADKVRDALPSDYIEIELIPAENNSRIAKFRSVGSEYAEVIRRIAAKWAT